MHLQEQRRREMSAIGREDQTATQAHLLNASDNVNYVILRKLDDGVTINYLCGVRVVEAP